MPKNLRFKGLEQNIAVAIQQKNNK
jgi:hypothetical protein